MSSGITKSINRNGRLVMSRVATIEEQGDRSFDIEFWRQMTSEQRAAAVWEMVVSHWEMKGKKPDELRLQRSVESIQRNGG